MLNLFGTAASRPSRYNSGSTAYTDFKNIYGLVQCTRDLSTTDCSSCRESLRSWIPGCCNRSTGAQIFQKTCYLRYEEYPFVQITVQSPPPPLPPVDASPPESNTVLLSAICSYFILMRIRRNKKKKTPELIYEQDEMGSGDSLQFDLNMIRTATNNFSDANKLGDGGFGAVYKIKLGEIQVELLEHLDTWLLNDLTKVSEAASDEFNHQLAYLLNNLSHSAASRPSKFYSGKTNNKLFSDLQSLVQCTRDLSATDCLSCLQSMIRFIPDCCARSLGAKICSTTCNIIFHAYPFLESPPLYDASGVEASPTQSNRGTGKRKSSTKVVAIVAPTIGLLLVLLAIFAYLRRNKRKRNPETNGEDDLESEQTLQFDLNTIKTATNDFSNVNKLGEGGFGAVYK
ncbi:Cysteine-rich receptor-like protein kinase, partial [Thalictrum thalictroides]